MTNMTSIQYGSLSSSISANGEEIVPMNVVGGYTQSILVPQIRSLGLSKRQWEIVVDDVTQRLESLLSHWNDEPFRRTILVLGTEEASFWEPHTASLDIRSLVVVAVRNSLIEDLGAYHPYTKALQSREVPLPDERMPWITSEAVKYFESANLDGIQVQPARDLFGDLSRRFPNAWYALSLLGGSSENEIAWELPMAEVQPMDISASHKDIQHVNVIASGIDPRLDDHLVDTLRRIKLREAELFFSPSFKHITRNPEKLLSIIDDLLRYGGTVLTLNYLLSPSCLARRKPLIRPAHYTSEIEGQVGNLDGLTGRHKELLALLMSLRR
jgi:hypothetical protein